ncbi:hypothetical protein [Paenibacillus puldeungensis]|uniref:hypothetical protein n=1 Tax=Paenibacillus puldeungensis TaxID=696536 RepID=UPI0036D29EEF
MVKNQLNSDSAFFPSWSTVICRIHRLSINLKGDNIRIELQGTERGHKDEHQIFGKHLAIHYVLRLYRHIIITPIYFYSIVEGEL